MSLFTGKAPEYCVCNWINQDNTCQVPRDWNVQLKEPLKTEWEAMVARGSYSTRADLFLFLQVLQETTAFEPAWFETCADVIPSVAYTTCHSAYLSRRWS